MKVLLALAFIKLVSCTINHNYLPPNRGGFSGSSFGSSHANAFSGAGFSSSGRQVPIVRYDNTNEGDGSYHYSFETGSGISAQEQGDARGDGTRAHGEYSYTAPDGQQIRVTYTADENGFRPEGAHLPTPPPIPDAILKSIQQNLAEEARGVVDDGSYRDNRGGGGHFGGSSFGGSHSRGGYSY